MKKEEISKAVERISDAYIKEAEFFDGSKKHAISGKRALFWRKALAVASALFLTAVVGVSLLFTSKETVYAYTYGSEEKLVKAGAVLQTGLITKDGEQKGHPLMFYLTGEEIESVRFSCKNQELRFTDWTEKREEYGLAGNFTVFYGKDQEEYPYLTIDWEPKETVRKLHEGFTIETLPKELKEDLIVMEITFAGGRQAVKAIHISLQPDGTFFAAYDDYEIKPSDTFVERDDALSLQEQTKMRLSETRDVSETTSEVMEEVSGAMEEASGVMEEVSEAMEAAGRYYEGTVFEVVSMEALQVSEEEAVFSVCVKKDGILQDPNRRIMLEKKDGIWKVAGEGY